MTFAIFTRSGIVTTTGWPQVADTVLVLISTCGVAFAMFGRFVRNPTGDMALRLLLAALAFLAMFHPNDTFVWLPGAIVLAMLLTGIWRHRSIAAPGSMPEAQQPAGPSASGDMTAMLTEAKRDIG
jgi:hypothetical protein